MRALLVLLLFTLLSACDSRSTSPAAKPAPTSAVLNAYRSLYFELGEAADLSTSHVYPHKPGLELDDLAGPEVRNKLVADLERWQPQIQQIMALASQDPGEFPPEPAEPSPETWPRAWLNRCAAVLQADAGRLWDAGKADDAVERLAALIKIGATMMKDSGQLTQMWGLARAGAGAIRANAMLDTGLLDRLAPANKSALLGAASSVRVTDEHIKRFDPLAPQTKSVNETLAARLQGH